MHQAKGPAVAAPVRPQTSGSGPQGPIGRRLMQTRQTPWLHSGASPATSRWLTAGRIKCTLLASCPFAHLESPER